MVQQFSLYVRYAAFRHCRLSFKTFLETYIGFAAVLSVGFCLRIQFSSFFGECLLEGSITNFALEEFLEFAVIRFFGVLL